MILVTGATGNLGSATIEFLLKKIPAREIAALVRDTTKATALAEKGITLKQGDYFDYPALVTAFAGVDKLLFISSGTMDKRTEQQLNVVNAAKEAGVKHIYYTSFPNSGTASAFIAGESHIATEEAILASGIPYTLLRNNLYMDVLPMLLGDALNSGQFHFPGGNGKVSFTLRNDMAEATANLLLADGQENTVYDFTNNTSYSLHDVVATLKQVTGQNVNYVDVPVEAFEEGLKSHGMPAEHAAIFASMGTAMKANEFNLQSTMLEDVLNRKPVSLHEFIKNTYSN